MTEPGGNLNRRDLGSLPPNDEREAWIQRNAALLRGALSDHTTRMRLLELLNGQERPRPGNDDESS
jgi:hypothetical protein